MISIPKLERLTVNKSPIYVDKEMAKSTQWYIKLEIENTETLQEALANNDFDRLVRSGNQLYEHGASFGFPYISNVGRSIEFAAKQKNCPLLTALISVLKHYLRSVSIVYV